jgi:hypothetical protein
VQFHATVLQYIWVREDVDTIPRHSSGVLLPPIIRGSIWK